MLTYISMGSFLFCLEGSTLFWSKGSNSFGLRGQSELDFPVGMLQNGDYEKLTKNIKDEMNS